ncbi:hypothetical protein ABZZ20_24440 [Streptomyces sp. NPDC006430]|uniref:hypothetical protein n=1 Tax=Streptomyces sp. NPDC006430 TaxID=3154299 RepID=UPI0033A77BB3
MADTYPLVEQREFGPPEQRGGLLPRKPRREQADLPRIAAHQVLVYRVGEEYVLDHGARRPDDAVVVSASSVSVVDRRVGVPLVVETAVPSAETDAFTLRVTFHCTVTDACAVVRDGVVDAEPLLLGRLREVPGLAEEGRDLPVMQTAELRDRVWSRLRAYEEMVPHVVSGVRVKAVGVEALTAAEVAAFQRAREEAERARQRDRFEAELAEERAKAEHERKLLEHDLRREQHFIEERHRQEKVLAEERHRQEMADLRAQFGRRTDDDQEEHRLRKETRANAHDRRETVADVDTFGYDPLAAHRYAMRRGEISADEMATRLDAAEETRYGRRLAADEVARLRLERQEEWAREDDRARLERGDRLSELERKDRREDAHALRHEETRRWDLEREDQLLHRREERDWQDRVLDAKRDLTKQVINRGHGDGGHVDVTHLINDVGSPLTAAPGPAYALEEGPSEVRVERADAVPETQDAAVAEDDDRGYAGREEGVG